MYTITKNSVFCLYMYMYACPFARAIYHMTVYLAGQPLCPEIQTFTSSETTLSFTWTHNKMCFTDCTTYNVSWRHVSKEKMLQNSTAVNETNCTIHDLMPGQNYSVQICAVCEGYNQTCTERKEYRTDPNPGTGEAHKLLHACMPCQLMILQYQ